MDIIVGVGKPEAEVEVECGDDWRAIVNMLTYSSMAGSLSDMLAGLEFQMSRRRTVVHLRSLWAEYVVGIPFSSSRADQTSI